MVEGLRSSLTPSSPASGFELVPHSSKRGRPRKYRPVKDFGTRELQHHRKRIGPSTSYEFGTLAYCVMQEGLVTKEAMEFFQKIYTIRRRYLKLITTNVDGKSFFLTHPFSGSRTSCTVASFQRENKGLERKWKKIRQEIGHSHGDLLVFIDRLFTLLPYDSLEGERLRFYEDYPPKKMASLALLAKEVF